MKFNEKSHPFLEFGSAQRFQLWRSYRDDINSWTLAVFGYFALWLLNQLDLNPIKFDFFKAIIKMIQSECISSVNYIQTKLQLLKFCRLGKSSSAVRVWCWVAVILAALTLICLPCAKTVYHKHKLSNDYWALVIK